MKNGDDPVAYMRRMAVQNAIETVLDQQEYVTKTEEKIAILWNIIDNLELRKSYAQS